MRRVVGIWMVCALLTGGAGVADEMKIEDPAKADPNVFFYEGFEDEGYRDRFTGTSHPQLMSLVTAPVFDGERCVRIRMEKDGHYGGSLIYKFADAGEGEPDELYARYYLRFGANWDPGRGGKLPGPSGTYGRAGWGGRPVSGRMGWSARMGFRTSKTEPGKTEVTYYTYHADMKGQYGDMLAWDEPLENERWYCIETYVKMNTIGKNDGVLRGWIDGRQAMERTDLRFRDVPELKVEQFWMNLYYGGKWPCPEDMDVYLDSVALSKAYIGPAKAVGGER